jgi:hypothetical protein
MGIKMTKSHWRLSGAVSLAAMLAAGAANAQSAPPTADQMDKADKTGAAKAGAAKADAADAAYATATPLAKAPPPTGAIVKMSAGNRPSICTADSLNCIS